MSKAVNGDDDVDFAAVSQMQEEDEFAEHQPLRIRSRETLSEELKDFAASCGLQHKLQMLSKALSLYHNKSPEEIPGFTDHEIAALDRENSHKWQQPKLLYFTILVCSIGAVEQGWAQTSMNGANLYFPQALGIGSTSTHDVFIVGLINSGIYLSVGLWGAWLSQPLNNRLGRRGAIFTGSALCLVANLGSAMSWNWLVLLFFRLLLGTGLGINASTISVYAAECAPASIRGGIAVSWQMWTAFGIFLGFVANVAVYNYGANTWRLQLAVPFIPAVPLLIMVYMCPESPAWHMKAGRFDRAYQSLSQLRNVEVQAAKELYASYLQQQARSKSTSLSSTSASYLFRFTELFSVPRIRNATIASYTVMLSQQLCGINIIAFYSSTIFSQAGFSTFTALLASCVFGFVNFLGAFPAVWTMDTLGRRSLLLWTLPSMAATLLVTGLSFKLPRGDAQFSILAALIYLFCVEYSPGMGPVPSAYSAEVFPLSHREVGMSFAVATANFWAAVLSLTFPGLLAWLGSAGAFELYAVLNIVAFVLVWLFVRETKQKTLDELDEVFTVRMRSWLRYVMKEELPWAWRRLVLRRKEMDCEPVMRSGDYRELGQDEDGEEEIDDEL